jgi:hypothetical protein
MCVLALPPARASRDPTSQRRPDALATIHRCIGVRTALIARIRAEIAAGRYLTPERLDLAMERLLDEITATAGRR